MIKLKVEMKEKQQKQKKLKDVQKLQKSLKHSKGKEIKKQIKSNFNNQSQKNNKKPAPPNSAPNPNSKLSLLQQKFAKKLEGGRFRYINEKLYTTTGEDSLKDFQRDPSQFEAYHQGFREQAAQWPVNPLDGIISWIKSKHPKAIVADMGCGDARLAASLPPSNKVHSFDLVSVNSRVVACDIAHTPLPDQSVDIVVFCLALMGTNLIDFIRETHRILKEGGTLKIVEVRSRFETVQISTHHEGEEGDDDAEDGDEYDEQGYEDEERAGKGRGRGGADPREGGGGGGGGIKKFIRLLKKLGFEASPSSLKKQNQATRSESGENNKMFFDIEMIKSTSSSPPSSTSSSSIDSNSSQKKQKLKKHNPHQAEEEETAEEEDSTHPSLLNQRPKKAEKKDKGKKRGGKNGNASDLSSPPSLFDTHRISVKPCLYKKR